MTRFKLIVLSCVLCGLAGMAYSWNTRVPSPTDQSNTIPTINDLAGIWDFKITCTEYSLSIPGETNKAKGEIAFDFTIRDETTIDMKSLVPGEEDRVARYINGIFFLGRGDSTELLSEGDMSIAQVKGTPGNLNMKSKSDAFYSLSEGFVLVGKFTGKQRR